MELRRYFAILRRRAWLIVLAVVVAVGFTAATTETRVAYSAKSTLYVGASSFLGVDDRLEVSGDQNSGVTQLIRTFATMIDSSTIAEDVVARTGVPRSPQGLVGATTAAAVPGTNILAIEVKDPDPAVAQAVATGFAEVFVNRIAELEPPQADAEGAVPAAPVRIFERAQLSVVPITSSKLSQLFVAGLVGLLVSAGAVLVGDYLDVTVKSAADAESRLELPVLGVIPEVSMKVFRTPRVAVRDTVDELELVGDG